MTQAKAINNIQSMISRRSVTGYQFRQGIDSFFHQAAAALGVRHPRLIWTDTICTAAVNSKGLVKIANVRDDAIITQTIMVKYVGFIIHELLHSKYTDFNVNSTNSFIDQLHNAVEDAWIEHTGIKSNLLGNISDTLSSVIDEMVTEALAEQIDWSDPCQLPFSLAVYLRQHASRKVPVPVDLKLVFDEAFKRTLKCTSSADTLKVAFYVFNALPKQNPQNNNQTDQDDQSQQADDQSQQADDQGQGQQGDAAQADGQGDGEQGDGQGNAAQTDQNSPTSPDQEQGKGKGTGNPADALTAPPVKPYDSMQHEQNARQVEPSLKPVAGVAGIGTYNLSARLECDQCHTGGFPVNKVGLPVPAKLRYEVKRLFDDSDTSNYAPNHKSGSVNARALKTIPMGNVSLFKRREEIEGIDSSVVIFLDVSQSMFDYTHRPDRCLISAAVHTCNALLETLSRAQVSTAVLTFGDEASILKHFATPYKRSLPLLETVRQGGGTNDYFALRYAHTMLLSRREQRKICFVITDGDGNRAAVKQQADAGRNLGITTIGVGIFNDISKTYGQGITINQLTDLGTATFKQIKLAA